MNLEINLVKTRSIYSDVVFLNDRKRISVENKTEILKAIKDFISNNDTVIDSIIKNRDLSNQINNIDKLSSIDEFYCVKYMLASTVGLDLVILAVSETEQNSTSVPEGIWEYNIIDKSNIKLGFIKSSTKILISREASLSELFAKISETYDLFKGDLFTGYKNPIETQLKILKQTENSLGVNPPAIISYLNSILKYLDKDICLIMS